MICTGGEGEIFLAGEGDGRVTGGGRTERSAEEKEECKNPLAVLGVPNRRYSWLCCTGCIQMDIQ